MHTEDKITEIFVMTDEFCKILMTRFAAETFQSLERTENGTIIVNVVYLYQKL